METSSNDAGVSSDARRSNNASPSDNTRRSNSVSPSNDTNQVNNASSSDNAIRLNTVSHSTDANQSNAVKSSNDMNLWHNANPSSVFSRRPSNRRTNSLGGLSAVGGSPSRLAGPPRSMSYHAHRLNSSSSLHHPSGPTQQGRRTGSKASSIHSSNVYNLFSTHNPFASAINSSPASRAISLSELRPLSPSHVPGIPGVYFRSRRIKKGETDRPELRVVDPMDKWVTIIPFMGICLGFLSIALLVWDGYKQVVTHEYCHVFTDDFSNGFNSTIWTKEVEVGGYGNGEFEITTGGDENVFVRDGYLVLKPTLEDTSIVEADTIFNLTSDGTCTSDVPSDCIAVGNLSTGAYINPVKSARINTKNFAVIKYGKVEVTAKLAAGDWLISSIWMLPAVNRYGPWPASGEIDIAMSRGNNYSNHDGGNNIAQSTLRWGIDADNDGWWRTNVGRSPPHSIWPDKFHTFGVEWSEKYLYTYFDSRLVQVLYVAFNVPFFTRGYFPATDANGSKTANPWDGPGTSDITPFDQPFYLILSLAVGGTSGWFTDGYSGKPWVDMSDTAKKDFWDARDEWYPTWQGKGKGEMLVKDVKMWQQCDG